MQLSVLLISCILGASALNPVVIKGSKFFDSVTKQQFFIKGIAYQPQNNGLQDPLADVAGCQRDIPNFKKLGLNVIRVYETYSHKNHDVCMKLLEDAGIYVMLDLPSATKAINRAYPSYDTELKKLFLDKVDAFAKYKNVIAFIAGNEVTNDVHTTKASAYVKAALRDTKAYVKAKGLSIPVGYADNDDEAIRYNLQSYFNCGSDQERADFYAINIYRWCGNSNFNLSGYNRLVEELRNYDKPTFLSEYGCNVVQPRQFTEINSIYGPDMTGVLSGGSIFEYSEEPNNYGLVKIQQNVATPLQDFNTVRQRMASVQPRGVMMNGYNPTNPKRACPTVSQNWQSGQKLPPTPNDIVCRQIYQTLRCKITSEGLKPSNGQAIGDQLGWLCNQDLCRDIVSDPDTGNYGIYSMCTSQVKNSIVYNTAFQRGYPCQFDGFASETNGAPYPQ